MNSQPAFWPAALEHLSPPAIPDKAAEERIDDVRLWLGKLLTTSRPEFGGRSRALDILDMLGLYLNGHVTLEAAMIDGALVSSTRSVPFTGHRGESVEHMTGKALLAAWLRGRGGEPQKEARLFGGRVDAYCPRLKVLAEVGDTSALRIIEMLTWEGAEEVYLLPISEPLGDLAHDLAPAAVPIVRFRLSEAGKHCIVEAAQ